MQEYFMNIFLPLLATFVISWLTGFERQNVGKSAGISSHVLVSMAACGIAIMQRQLFVYEFDFGKPTPEGQRVIAQVVTGIGFIGAGVILKSNRGVKGLTTAATLWSSAMTGLILGMGYWEIGLTLGSFIVVFMYLRDMIRKFNPFKIHRSIREDSSTDDE